MSSPAQAVLLSCASQDAEAAGRIAAALSGTGVEVWFDRREPCGEAWESTLRWRIQDCALFLPVVSAGSQCCLEGDFRLEWRLADERARQIGDAKAFIVPIAIDDTAAAEANLPPSFKRVPWLQALNGEVPAAFGAHIAALLAGAGTGKAALEDKRHTVLGDERHTTRTPREGAAVPVQDDAGGSGGWIGPVAAAVFLVAMLVLQPWHRAGRDLESGPGREAGSGIDAAPRESVAVLPFVDASEKRDQSYLSVGMTEEIIDRLTRIPGLDVAGRTSSFIFTGAAGSPAAIAQQLHVSHLIVGSVRRSGNRLHVAVQLNRAADGHLLWSETYDPQFKQAFAVEDDIAQAVAAALTFNAPPRPRPAISRHTAESDAEEQYMIGRELQRRGKSDDWTVSLVPLRRAIALDPAYAAAYAALAYSEASIAEIDPDPLQVQRAEADAAQAVALAPDAPDGYAARAYIRTYLTWEWAGAGADIERALALDPGDSELLENRAALLARLGRLPEAIGAARRSAELDPLSVAVWLRLGRYLTANAQYAAADAAIRRALALQPDNPNALNDLGTLRLVESNASEALAAFRRINGKDGLAGIAMAEHSLGQVGASNQALVEAIARYAGVMAYQIAEVYAWRGQRDLAFEWMDQAYRQHDAGLCFLKFDPLLDSLRHDPRFQALLREMKLPE